MQLFVTKDQYGNIKPAYSEDADLLAKLRVGEEYKVTIQQARNVRFHRKFFALLQFTLDNLPDDVVFETPDGQQIQIRSIDDLLWHVKMQIGHYEQRMTLGGKITYETKSISFEKMDELEFQDVYNRAVDAIIKYILPGVEREDLIETVALSF